MNDDVRDTESAELPISGDALSGAVSKLLEHPELISMVASALGGSGDKKATASEILPAAAQANTASEPQGGAEALASVAPLLSRLSSAGAGKEFRHAQLLRALKPYVSEGRCEAIDYMLRISQLSSLLNGKIKG